MLGASRRERAKDDGVARLIVIQGPRHDTYDLGGEEATIGRGKGNTICLEDGNCSRFHCSVDSHLDRYRVSDCGSFNGTYLNNTKVDVAFLSPGDKIQVGGTIIYFVLTEDEVSTAGGKAAFAKAGAADMAADSSAQTSALTAQLDTSQPKDLGARIKNLQTLLDVGKAVNSELDHDRLLELIMDHAIQLLGAERGFVILKDSEAEKGFRFAVARNIDRGEVDKQEFNVSSNIIRKVLETGEPILSSNAQDEFGQFLSIIDLELRALLCVPLKAKEKILGTLYLDSRDSGSSFSEDSVSMLQAFADQAGIALENARLVSEVRDKERMKQELRIASQIQEGLEPKRVPEVPGLQVLGYMDTAKEIGGDYYDYMYDPHDGDSCYVAVGDVSGKGVGAGLVMVMSRSIMHTALDTCHNTHQVLCELNKNLKRDLRPGMFMSMSLWRWDGKASMLKFTSAGAEKPLVRRAASGVVEILEPGGIVLGVVGDVGARLDERELALESGDMVILYTDGITEAMNPSKEEFGLERFIEAIGRFGNEPPKQFIDALVDGVREFTAGAEQHDDITMAVMQRI